MSKSSIVLKDWRGHEYSTGSTIIYCTSSGSSSAKMTEGKVTDIYRVYDGDYGWTRVPDGEEPPFKMRRNQETWELEETGERKKTELKIRVLATRTSDEFLYQERGITGQPWSAGKVGKEVTLTRTDHVTCVPKSVNS